MMKILVFFGTILLICYCCKAGILKDFGQMSIAGFLASWMFVWWCTPERGIFGMFKSDFFYEDPPKP